MEQIRKVIEGAWEQGAASIASNRKVCEAVEAALAALDAGKLRVADKINGSWQVNDWVKKAILLSFRINPNHVSKAGEETFFDKVNLKFTNYDDNKFKTEGMRVVPGAVVRYGAHISKGAVLMPSFVNIGAYVGENTMVDTWATVGSCAQVGANCHLSGGVGIGGVLEPLQANPTIIEDNCFIGARSEIAEGVIVEENSVIAMGTFIGQSTKIYDRTTGEFYQGRVPSGSVVVTGSLPRDNGKYNLNCAIIVKRVDARTRSKTSINDLLRD